MDPVRDKNLESSDSPSASVSNGTDFFKRHILWFSALVLALFLYGCYFSFSAPPADFPSGNITVIPRGASLSTIAEELYDAHIIKHPSVLKILFRISGASSSVKSGAYLFKSPEDAFVVAGRLAMGDYGLPPVRITFPEGMTVRDMSEKITEAIPLVSAQEFLSAGKPQEGYLFPDTYLFPPDATTASILEALRANFNAKIAPLASDIGASGRPLADIVTMASLVEKEARTDVNRSIVAGVLWNRINRGMALQVDAVFGYIFNRDTYSPSYADLKVDSPYNTYIHTGLPPGPICNPGLGSLQAVLHPTKTNYFYYLTDKNGVMHYATTYAEHQSNQRAYLK